MGFWTLHEDYQEHAAKLRVLYKPPVAKLLKMISSKPPTNKETAKKYLKYLSTRFVAGEFNESQLEELSKIAFVPTSDTELSAPCHCYVGKSEFALHEQMFKFVDFGGYANSFLQTCGAQERPAVDGIAGALSLIGGIPQYVLQSFGSSGF
jgi:hypothetical protein